MVETVVALLALAPFLGGTALLAKQLDVKHKSYDALRYSVWERTVWSETGTHGKSAAAIELEAFDRALGHPLSGLSSLDSLRTAGVSQNPFWYDGRRRPLLTNDDAIASTQRQETSPVEPGYVLMPALAYGEGAPAQAAHALRTDHLNLNRRTFAVASVEVGVQPVLAQLADRRRSLASLQTANRTPAQLTQRAGGAVLSDTWSSRDENEFGRRIDALTANELIEALEMPARPLAMQSLGKGRLLYGEGQFGWDANLRPRSNVLPAAYITDGERN